MVAMMPRILLCVLVVVIHVLPLAAWTNPVDRRTCLLSKKEVTGQRLWKIFSTLEYLRGYWPNWNGEDPCGSSWEGIECKNSQVISIVGLNGQLRGDIRGLSELETLDLSYNKDLNGVFLSLLEN